MTKGIRFLFFFSILIKLNYEGRPIEIDRTLAILNRKRIAFDGGFAKFRLRDCILISRLLEDKDQSKVLASCGHQTESNLSKIFAQIHD